MHGMDSFIWYNIDGIASTEAVILPVADDVTVHNFLTAASAHFLSLLDGLLYMQGEWTALTPTPLPH